MDAVSTEEYPKRAWLSYRHKNDDHIAARTLLEDLCGKKGIKLVYDKNGTKEGDSLIQFMRDLSASRFIFIFLDPDYLASPYTVHELIAISEVGLLEERIIVPVRVSEAMVAIEATRQKRLWNGDDDGWNELARQLRETDLDELARRLDKAWKQVVYPHLDQLRDSAENRGWQTILETRLKDIETQQNDAVQKSEDRLKRQLVAEIERILQYGTLPAQAFRRELRLLANADCRSIATNLLNMDTVSKAIAALTRVAQRQKAVLGERSSEWKACFVDAEEICGWLLLASTDHAWWYHNKLRFAQQVESDVTREIPLQVPAFIEIVIARSVVKWAKYRLGKDGKAKPAQQRGSEVLFDAISSEATDITLLSGIYRDLLRGEPSGKDRDELLDDVCNRAEARFNRTGKPVYYLMPNDTIRLLNSADWFRGMKERLLGKIQFICCDAPCKPYELPPTQEDQALLLAQLAEFLSLEESGP